MNDKKSRKAISIIKDPDVIRLLADFTRSEILRLLSERSMTETQLAKELGLTKAAIGYHLRQLKDAGLIALDKVEAEEHGILRKYYLTTAAFFIVDPDYIPEDVKRYFLEVQIEHLRGMLSVFKFYNKISEISSEKLEELAEAMLRQLKAIGEKHIGENVENKDVESLIVKIYAEALASLTKQKEWRCIFQK